MIVVTLFGVSGVPRKMSFNVQEVLIGRTDENDVVLAGDNVSMHHARIVVKDSQLILADLMSTNGTYVNGQKLSAPYIIKDNDTISIGGFLLKIEREEPLE